jgi:integrase/recombinase XerD
MRLDETVDHYLLNVEARRYSIHTQIGYRHDLSVMVRLLADLCHVVDLERVTILHLRQCVHHLLNAPVEVKRGRPPENGLTLSTVAVGVYIRRWKTFFSWCFEEELLEKNPAIRLEFPRVDEKVIDSFSKDQLEQMLDVFDLSTPVGFRDYVIILLMLDTGIRRSEVVTLRVEDVHETYISVFGKGRRERQVGIHSKISNLLWKYVHKYRRPAHPGEPALFLSIGKRHAGLPLGRGGINGLIGRLKKATGIDEVRLSAHTFRHTFAVMYLDEGGDLFSLSREMGHKDVKTTEKYLKSFTSKNARMQHNDHSPLNAIELRSERRRGKGQKKKPGR